jgi:hypothetical protein
MVREIGRCNFTDFKCVRTKVGDNHTSYLAQDEERYLEHHRIRGEQEDDSYHINYSHHSEVPQCIFMGNCASRAFDFTRF